MTELERCPRCNRTEFVHKRRSAECTWCWARLTKRSRDSYHFEPFLWYRPHTPAAAQMHTQAAAQQPHPTTGPLGAGTAADCSQVHRLARRQSLRPMRGAATNRRGPHRAHRSQDVRVLRLRRRAGRARNYLHVAAAPRRQSPGSPPLLQPTERQLALCHKVASPDDVVAARSTQAVGPPVPLGARTPLTAKPHRKPKPQPTPRAEAVAQAKRTTSTPRPGPRPASSSPSHPRMLNSSEHQPTARNQKQTAGTERHTTNPRDTAQNQ